MVVVVGPPFRPGERERPPRADRSVVESGLVLPLDSEDVDDADLLFDRPFGGALSSRVAATVAVDPNSVSGVGFNFGPFRRGATLAAILITGTEADAVANSVFECHAAFSESPLPDSAFSAALGLGGWAEPVFQPMFGFPFYAVRFHLNDMLRLPVGAVFDRLAWLAVGFTWNGAGNELLYFSACIACERPFRKRRATTLVM